MDGKVAGIVGIAIDITERKRAEEELRNAETRYRALFEQSPNGVLLIDLETGQTIEANETAYRQLGYTREEFAALRISDYEALEKPEETAEHMQRVLREGSDDFETLHRTKSGEIRNMRVLAKTVQLSERGFFYAIFQDITERKQTEREVAAYARLGQQLSAASTAKTAAGIILATARELLGWDAAFLNLYFPATGLTQPVLNFDTLNGQVTEFPVGPAAPPSPMMRRALEAGGQLILADAPETQPPDLTSFGDETRPSAALLFVPIRADQKVVGVLSIQSYTPRAYTPESLGTLQALADHAAGALERLATESAEREQRTLAEALLDTAAALNSTLDRDELLGRILENVKRVVPHDAADIMLIEAGVARIVRHRGHAERGTEVAALAARFTLAETPNLQEMIASGQPMVISDVQDYPDWVATPELEWIRSYIGAPIRVAGQIAGFINLDSATPGFFTATHAERLRAFAHQAATALENARLLTRQRLAELEALHTVSTALRLAQTRDEALPILLDETLAALETNAGVIWLYHPEGNELRRAVARGWFKQLAELPMTPGQGIAGTVFASGQAHISPEFAHDPLVIASARPQIPTGWGGICLPIRSSTGTVGVLFVSVPLPRQITGEQITLLESLTEMASAALHRMSLHEETVRRADQLEALHNIDLAITASVDLRLTLNVLLEQVTRQLNVDAACVLLLNPHVQTLEYAAGRGFQTSVAQTARVRLGESFAGRAALERHTVQIVEPAQIHHSPHFAALWAGEGFAAYFGVPLIAKGEVKGVLEVFHRSPLAPEPDWLSFLETLGGQAAIAIDNAQLFDNLQRSNLDLTLAYDATIEGWSRALDLRDKETEGHTQRVTELTLRLTQPLGLSEVELVHVRRGALLHDIGKMGVPDSILLKAGSLTDDEWKIMRRHPQLAHDLLAPIAYLRPALDIPYYHHEKWDGTGYPHGLKGEQIPLAARLFAVVDVWDALRSDRPYRPAWPKEKVLEHIRSQAGTHFDPRVVDVFLSLMDKD
jgi:PAS domain S-box-containing protein